jgi:hypothetical protein
MSETPNASARVWRDEFGKKLQILLGLEVITPPAREMPVEAMFNTWFPNASGDWKTFEEPEMEEVTQSDKLAVPYLEASFMM